METITVKRADVERELRAMIAGIQKIEAEHRCGYSTSVCMAIRAFRRAGVLTDDESVRWTFDAMRHHGSAQARDEQSQIDGDTPSVLQ